MNYYTEEQVKELLNKQKEKCAGMVNSKFVNKIITTDSVTLPTPAMVDDGYSSNNKLLIDFVQSMQFDMIYCNKLSIKDGVQQYLESINPPKQ